MNKWAILVLPLIVLKFWNLGLVPIFYDEAIYLSEASRITQDLHNLFIVYFEGAQFPIWTWVLAVVNIFSHNFLNLLISGRLTTVTIDVISAFMLFLIGKKLFDKKAGIFATLIYLSLPLTFIHGRFIGLEPLTNLFSLVAVYFILQEKYISLVIFSLLAFFTKPTAAETLLAGFFWPFFKSPRNFHRTYQKFLPAILITIVIILAVFIPLLGGFSRHINAMPSSFQDFLSNSYFNFHRVFLWMQEYLTIPSLLLVTVSLTIGTWQKRLPFLWLGVWLVIIVLVSSVVGKHLYPRHIYFVAVPAALLVAAVIQRLEQYSKQLAQLVLIVIIVFMTWTNLHFLLNPKSVLAGEDRQQFYEDWTSGAGLAETADKLRSLSVEKKINAFVENNTLAIWALPTVFSPGNVRFHILDLQKIPPSGSYLVLLSNANLPSDWPVLRLAIFAKGPNRTVEIYQVL